MTRDDNDEPQDDHSEDEEFDLSESLIDSDLERLIGSKKKPIYEGDHPDELFILPLTRRPFFPGMAAPLVIEPGPFYEVLKMVAKSSHKTLALFLTKKEEVNIYEMGFEDLCDVGVMATILRIVPLEQGGAQVVLNMEKRIKIEEPLPKSKY
ncbi:MAG: LON peptidase substrate-binding domain-containing protein, partial [Chlamydiia bacterium]|nr:LON peptidase substrate-binding domain-containing protein [Chlamydiia bacterium]